MTTGFLSPTTWRRGIDRDAGGTTGAALLLVVALALAAVLPVSARAADCSLSLVQCLDVDFPVAYSLGSSLNAGTTTTSSEQILRISSTASWGVRIQTDLADGRMKQFNGSTYLTSGQILTNPLGWALVSIAGTPQTPSYTALSSAPATVVTGRPANCLLNLLCTDSTIGVRHRLTTSFADRRVAPHSYRALVTYSVSHGF